ncbi:DUF4402 domain-containing protein [Sphingobium sp. B11D3D]|uniref:DUF4402 domain-containing protein n=1 Tax=Sphingobium sp. B11D3D TaxID=2940576 RepID=UPI002223FE8C|nr:DUF4402 domain-containing protein [Sphingobium sp. B11D3D]
MLWVALPQGSALAQSFTVNTITTNTPNFGNVAAAASGDTDFAITTSGAVSSAAGSGGNIASGTKSAATVTIRCSGGSACTSATAIVRLFSLTTISGRAQKVKNFTVASGTGTVGAVTTNPDGSITFPLTGFSSTSSRTFLVGMTLPILGDNASTSTSASASWGVGVAKSPTVPSASSLSRNAMATIRKSLTLTKSSDLAFGAIRPPASGSGTVSISNVNGARSIGTGSPVLLPGLTSGRAQFSIGGQASTAITVTMPGSLTMSGSGGGTLSVTLSPSASGAQTLNTSGSLTLGVGGTLTVPSSTASGDYAGSFAVTVSYN